MIARLQCANVGLARSTRSNQAPTVPDLGLQVIWHDLTKYPPAMGLGGDLLSHVFSSVAPLVRLYWILCNLAAVLALLPIPGLAGFR